MRKLLNSMALLAVCVPSIAFATPMVITDASQLDFTGDFVYAVNFHGSGTQTVGDATFTNVNSAGGGAPLGVAISGFDRTYGWSINLGTGANNDALENVMNGLIWSLNLNPGAINVDVEVGSHYRLQLLYGEGCCSNRNFDVDIESSLFHDEVIGTATGGPVWVSSRTQGYAMVLDYMATDSTLNIDLSRARSGDTNYHISGFTVEKIPEPTSIILLGLGLVGLGFSRRRKA